MIFPCGRCPPLPLPSHTHATSPLNRSFRMRGLSPCMQALGEFSSQLSFVAPPAPGAPSLSFIAIADMGQAEPDGSNEMTEMVAALRTQRLLAAHAEGRQLLLHNGDISYAM